MQIKGIFYTILSAVFFGITPILTTVIYGYGANAITAVFFRSLFVIPILYGIMRWKHIPLRIKAYDVKNIAIIAIFGSGLTTILLFSSYSYVDVGTATTLHFLYPVCVSVLCYFVYKEKLGKRKMISLGMAILGTLCFFNFNHSENINGVLLAASSALAYAFYMVQMEKCRLTHMNAYKVSFYIAIFILLETIAYHIITPEIHLFLPLKTYGLLLILSIVSSFLAVTLLQLGIKHLGSSTASLFCLFEPITSIICGYFILHEQLTLLKMIGCFIILSALAIMCLPKKKSLSTHNVS